MQWLEPNRIPEGRWPFLMTVHASLREMEIAHVGEIDLKAGGDHVLVSSCVSAYHRAVVNRVLDLVQATVISWNASLIFGAVVNARALLETIAVFHSFLGRAQKAAHALDWAKISSLLDGYAFSSTVDGIRQRSPEGPPRIGIAVTEFLRATQPKAEKFWAQICDVEHPNGRPMMEAAGNLVAGRFVPPDRVALEAMYFPAIFNCLFSCCWLASAELDLEILLEEMLSGGPLASDHELIVRRNLIDEVSAGLSQEFGPMKPGPIQRAGSE